MEAREQTEEKASDFFIDSKTCWQFREALTKARIKKKQFAESLAFDDIRGFYQATNGYDRFYGTEYEQPVLKLIAEQLGKGNKKKTS